MPADVRTTTDEPAPAQQDVVREWARRAERRGLARVMRASQPTELNSRVTAATRRIVADYLRITAADLGRPLASALEVGCGVGRLTPTLAGHAEHVTAIDMTPGMLDAARSACAGLDHVDFLLAPAEELPWQPRTFDVSLCVWVLMHLLDEERLRRVCASLAASSRYLVLIEYERARIPVSRWSRLRPLDTYLTLMPGAQVVEERSLDYGGDRSTAALIRFPHPA